MTYWNALLDNVLDKDNPLFLFSEEEDFQADTFATPEVFQPEVKRSYQRNFRYYYLGKEFPGIYFTKREAECIYWIVQNNTLKQTARIMNLSARTVEFYVKNMKLKLRCANKKQLINTILKTTLLAQLEKDGLKIVRH